MYLYSIILSAHIVGSAILFIFMFFVLQKIIVRQVTNLKKYSNILTIFSFYQVISGLLLWLTNKTDVLLFCQKIIFYIFTVFAFQLFLRLIANRNTVKIPLSQPLATLGISILISLLPLMFVNYI